VVHGGANFTKTVIINAGVKEEITFALAPLHNPANLEGIIVAESIFTNATQIAVV
jgi:acetate kinase